MSNEETASANNMEELRGTIVSGGGRAKDMINTKIKEDDEDKRMRSWKTKKRSKRST
jgi:hypothetical protein